MANCLPSGREFLRRTLLHTGAYSLGAIAVISLYLSGLLRLSSDQWWGFLQIVALVFALLFPAMTLSHRRIFQRIQRCLDRHADGTVSVEELRSGFAAVTDFPRYWYVWGLGWWAIGGAAVGCGMWLRYPDFGALGAVVVFCGSVSGALLTDTYYYLSVKRRLRPIRAGLAAEVGDHETRQQLVRRVPLRTKLMVAMTSVIMVTVGFAALLSHTRSQRLMQQYTLHTQQHLLDALVLHEAFSFDEASRQAARFGAGATLILLDAAAERVLAGPARAIGESELRHIRQLAPNARRGTAYGSSDLFSWHRLPGDQHILVVTTPPVELGEDAGTKGFLALLVFSTLVGVGVAFLLARDVGEATEVLRSEAARVARGDLTAGEIFEAEDEMGELAGSFELMAASLRNTVSRVAGAADRMQSAASEIALASRGVAQVTTQQIQGVAQATTSMGEIEDHVRGIVRSAVDLNRDIADASASILQLESAGGELSESASVLSTNVGEVASSIDQMGHNISQVTENSQILARAADDASGGMTQTAAAVRKVDHSSTEMSQLSTQVIALAEGGRERVRETIRGMDAIQEATDLGQHVIRKLASRATEIGSVISVIDDVADETSLLALNAAIIAAQSGEHGRPFAVVADEIKDLAERVIASTKEIGQLIRAVQQESGEATAAIERGSQTVKRGMSLGADAGAALDEITQAAQLSGSRIAEIVRSVKEQAHAMGHVAGLMTKVRAGTEQIHQAIEEQERATGLVRGNASTMDDVSKQLHRTTQEQAQSATQISKNVQSVRDLVTRINSALQEQSVACRAAVEFLQSVSLGTRSNEDTVQQLDQAMGGLLENAEELRREVEQFRI
jgi:methyl-accepting chemotaxis protein